MDSATRRNVRPDLSVLYEKRVPAAFRLPDELVQQYGGPFGLAEQTLYANFVSSVDGVVALTADGESGAVISQNSAADRFVMGLLRACADAVIVGAGTFRKASGHLWQADTIYPPAAALFAQVRADLGLSPHPKLVLVSHSGRIDIAQPALRDALIATSAPGAQALHERAPGLQCMVLSDGMHLTDLVALLHQQGLRRLLTEGGPSIFAQLLSERLVDEIFLTSAPTLFGRFPADNRKALTDGVDFAGTTLELQSLRHHDSHLFLRYTVETD